MWLYLPSTISPSSQEPEDWTSPSDLQFQKLSASVTVNGKSALPASLRLAWKTGALNRLRSGLTCEPSRANSSVTAWLESLGASRVRTSRSRAKEKASAESIPDSGLSTSESFARCGPDGSLWRTSPQLSLFPQEELYSEGLPKSGSMRSGFLFERPMSRLRTEESGSSFWPTTAVPNGGRSSNTSNYRPDGSKQQVELAAFARNLIVFIGFALPPGERLNRRNYRSGEPPVLQIIHADSATGQRRRSVNGLSSGSSPSAMPS